MEILVISGNGKGAGYRLREGESLVGRDEQSVIRLDDPEVGRRHCRLLLRHGVCELEDLRSGGTSVNGEKLQRCRLKAGDRIRIGGTVLELRDSPASRTPDPEQSLPALLGINMMVVAFRSLPVASGAAQAKLRQQISQLVGDILPAEEIEVYVQGQDGDSSVPGALVRRLQAGDPVIGDDNWVAMPFRVFGKTAGYLALRIPDSQLASLPAYQEILAAIACIGSTALENSRELERVRVQNELLRQRLEAATAIVGKSEPVRKMVELVKRVAPREATVLILGESGTGKELVARAIHDLSPRRDAPFIAINCATLSETLLESELFGHEKGAFTGAVAQKKGKLELAEGGTVLLDEIGEMASTLQAKLLRVLQHREFERVGGTKTIPLDIRLLAATNRDLAARARSGEFREDLYHRLNVVTIAAPPLRERQADIIVLARYFLSQQSDRLRRHVTGFSPEAEAKLRGYSWPGNVRELENAVERAVILGSGDLIEVEDLPDAVRGASAPERTGRFKEKVQAAKKDSILQAYHQAAGDYKKAAKILGYHPNYLLKVVRLLGLKQQVRQTKSSG